MKPKREKEYDKLENPNKATMEDRINDLRIRAGHYYQQTRRNGKRKMLLSKRLKIITLIITASVALLLTLQVSWVLSSPLMVLILALLSWLSAVITVVQTISFDDAVNAKLFHIFNENEVYRG